MLRVFENSGVSFNRHVPAHDDGRNSLNPAPALAPWNAKALPHGRHTRATSTHACWRRPYEKTALKRVSH